MIEAFIFDLDGVITDTAYYHYLAWKELGNKIGIEIDEEFNETLKGISRIESLERMLVFGNKENQFTQEEKLQLATEKNEHYKELIKRITPNDILPGIIELLEEAKNNKIKIGLASASKNAIPVLNSLGVIEYFDFIADASECKNSKPAPDIFLMAVKGLNVNPKYCIGFEDASAGVDAINSAMMYSVGIGDTDTLCKAKYVVKSTQELDFNLIISKYNKSEKEYSL